MIETLLPLTELIVKVTCLIHNILIDLDDVNLENFHFNEILDDVLLHAKKPNGAEKDKFVTEQGRKGKKFEKILHYFLKSILKKNDRVRSSERIKFKKYN